MASQKNPGGYMISFDSLADYAPALEANTSSMNLRIPAR